MVVMSSGGLGGRVGWVVGWKYRADSGCWMSSRCRRGGQRGDAISWAQIRS